MPRIGIYIIGARGNVGACVIVGALALRAGKATPTGLVTAASDFDGVPLAGFGDIALGGCDIVDTGLYEKARSLAVEGRMLPLDVVEALKSELVTLGRELDKGVAFRYPRAPQGGFARAASNVRARLEAFRTRTKAECVIVVNLASTEPLITLEPCHESAGAFAKALMADKAPMTQAMLYAWCAFQCGMCFVNFTPSQANDVAALRKLALERKLPHAGKDGKTGETLLKTVLGPMFVARNLKVLSWLADNYLGNDDGRTLHDPAARGTKLASKNEALRSILGQEPYISTNIGYAPSLGDWKTAADLIHFEGFLGTRMTMSFVWQGCDSALAAPLVLDLARLVEMAARKGEKGELGWLACFFKSPQGCGEHAFARQVDMLHDHVAGWRADAGKSSKASGKKKKAGKQ